MTKRHHRYRVVKPVRFFIFVFMSIMIVSYAAFGLFNLSTAQAESVTRYQRVVVQENDTLWDLAISYNPDVRDARNLVHEIYEVNDITASDLHPGDIIYIPVH